LSLSFSRGRFGSLVCLRCQVKGCGDRELVSKRRAVLGAVIDKMTVCVLGTEMCLHPHPRTKTGAVRILVSVRIRNSGQGQKPGDRESTLSEHFEVDMARSSWLTSCWYFIAPYLNVTASGALCRVVWYKYGRLGGTCQHQCVVDITRHHIAERSGWTFTVIHLSCSCISNIFQTVIRVSEDGGGRLRRNVCTCHGARQYIAQDPSLKCDSPLQSSGHYMYHQFNIQQLYVLPTLYLCVLYLCENKQRLVPLTA